MQEWLKNLLLDALKDAVSENLIRRLAADGLEELADYKVTDAGSEDWEIALEEIADQILRKVAKRLRSQSST